MADLFPEVLVVGAGPAGLAAALAAAHGGAQVLLLDRQAAPGGQIWRGVPPDERSPAGERLRAVRENPRIHVLSGAEVAWVEPYPRTVVVSTPAGPLRLVPQKIILASGAGELFLPFPGWTLPGVVGAGALQAMVKSGLEVRGRSIVLAGSGPLLLAVAATLHRKGARVLAVAEQAPLASVAHFGWHLGWPPAGWRGPRGKRQQLAEIAPAFLKTPYWADTYPLRVLEQGGKKLVTLSRRGQQVRLPCDLLAVGFGLQPDTRLAQMLGCELQQGAVKVGAWNQTSVPGVYAAGEVTGVGGVEKALAEGRWAGYAATGQVERLRGKTPTERYQATVRVIREAFTLRPALRRLPAPDTIICRCEDVRHAELSACHGWAAAKLHTRCGRGTCQGRVCGPATEALYGWAFESVRPPLTPVPIAALLHGTSPHSLPGGEPHEPEPHV